MPETRQVLMQRVIALNGVPESPANAPSPAKIDLSRTVVEGSIQENAPSDGAAPPALRRREPAHAFQSPADSHWATHSSISLEICEDSQLPPRILNTNVEDAVTHQFSSSAQPLATSITDLASLDRALESAGVLEAHELATITNVRQPLESAGVLEAHELVAGTNVRQPSAPEPNPPEVTRPNQAAPAQRQPRMVLVPASIVWAVLTVFALCTLALTLLVIVYIVRGPLSPF